MNEKKLGKIVMNAEGLRRLANSMDVVYGVGTVINLPIWTDDQKILFFQIDKGTGAINLVDKS